MSRIPPLFPKRSLIPQFSHHEPKKFRLGHDGQFTFQPDGSTNANSTAAMAGISHFGDEDFANLEREIHSTSEIVPVPGASRSKQPLLHLESSSGTTNAGTQPRFRRTLFPDPIMPSQTGSMVVDYGHYSHNDATPSMEKGRVSFDYGHGTERKEIQPFSSDSASGCQETDDTSDYRLGKEFYYRLAIDSMNQHDKSYEQSIWDYDPKFTWDYLPGTSRGADKPKEFVCGRNFYEEETKWKRHSAVTGQIYSHEIAERMAKLEKGESLYDEESDQPISIRPIDPVDNTGAIFKRFEEEIGFPEDGVKDDFCQICEMAFDSALASMQHYEGSEHEKQLRQYFVDGLLKMGVVRSTHTIPSHYENGIIKRGMKKYKTRPDQWLCDLCDVPLSSLVTAKAHFNGVAHLKRRETVRNALI